MSADPRPNDAAITQAALTCKIIASALIAGILGFAAVAIVMRLGKPPADGATVSLIGVGLAMAAVIARQVVLGLMSGRTDTNKQDPGASLALYQTRMIVGMGIPEGAAFFNVNAYLLEGRWWSLAVAAALVAVILAAYPTRTRIHRWVEDREQLKTFGPGEPR